MSKSDLQQLKGILEEFNEETIHQAIRELKLTPEALKPIQKRIRDLPKFVTGPKAKEGDEGVTSLEALSDQKPLERVIGVAEFLPVHFLEEGAIVQRAVGRVKTSGWFGSGFLVAHSLLLTNNHVLPSSDIARQAKAEFNYQLDYQGNPTQVDSYDVDPDSYFRTSVALDYTLVRLKPHGIYRAVAPVMAFPSSATLGTATARMTPLPFGTLQRLVSHAGDVWGSLALRDTNMAIGQRVNVIQHPLAGYKQCCLHDNKVTETYANVVHYTTDTEPGSSGSPVFDNEWELIALHHAAGDFDAASQKWLDNEGVRIDKIIDDLQSALRGTPNQGILSELGIP